MVCWSSWLLFSCALGLVGFQSHGPSVLWAVGLVGHQSHWLWISCPVGLTSVTQVSSGQALSVENQKGVYACSVHSTYSMALSISLKLQKDDCIIRFPNHTPQMSLFSRHVHLQKMYKYTQPWNVFRG